MNEFTDFKTYKMKNQKTYQYVFDYFSEQILSGELKINDKILPEREIAEKLDVSRNSIREVMHMLEINGLLTAGREVETISAVSHRTIW